MTTSIHVSRFDDCLALWRAADEQALRAERKLARGLDLYMEGSLPPSLQAIAEARQMRQSARESLQSLLGCIEHARAGVRLI